MPEWDCPVAKSGVIFQRQKFGAAFDRTDQETALTAGLWSPRPDH
jgi:hypothetical protein